MTRERPRHVDPLAGSLERTIALRARHAHHGFANVLGIVPQSSVEALFYE